MSCLYILEIKALYCIIFKYFIPVHSLSFLFVYVFLFCEKAYKFDYVPFVNFAFISIALGDWYDVRECFASVLF